MPDLFLSLNKKKPFSIVHIIVGCFFFHVSYTDSREYHDHNDDDLYPGQFKHSYYKQNHKTFLETL